MINHFLLSVSDGVLTANSLEAKDLNLPEITREFDTDDRVGYVGKVPIPLKFGEMTASFTCTKVTRVLRQILSGLAPITLTFRGVEIEGGSYNTVVTTVVGFTSTLPMGEFAADGTGEYNFEIMATQIQESINGVVTLRFIPESYIYEVNGVNLLERIAGSLGI